MNRRKNGEEIRSFVVENVEDNPRSIARLVSERFGVSRQTANYHLSQLVGEGVLVSEGIKRGKRYLVKYRSKTVTLEIKPDLAEHRIWSEEAAPFLSGIPSNVLAICQYGLTEILNNAIVHSEGKEVKIDIGYRVKMVVLSVSDNGIGIFKKIATDLKLEDQRHAILELSKGKLTTEPERHTGEGIFFATRMFDEFSILSGQLFFHHFHDGDDWLVETRLEEHKGTLVEMSISTQSGRTTQEVFDRYASESTSYDFARTHVPVALATYGDEKLVSRSQARRLLARFDRFEEVLLDFEGVTSIGQAFADEIFRVYRNEKPYVRVDYVRATDEVAGMIRRATGGRDVSQLVFPLAARDQSSSTEHGTLT